MRMQNFSRAHQRDGDHQAAEHDHQHLHLDDCAQHRPGKVDDQEVRMANVRSKSCQTSTTPDPESALQHISQEIATHQARLMERDIDRVHHEAETRLEDL